MDTHMTKAQADLLLSFPITHGTDRAEAWRLAAGRARDADWRAALVAPFRALAQAVQRRRMLSELGSLTDRQLADIGLTRAELGQVPGPRGR